MLGRLNALKIGLCFTLIFCSAVYAQTRLDLTSADQDAIWHSLGRDATRTSIPAGLHVGERVPDSMRLFSFSRHVRKKIPAIGGYSYALLQGQVLIVDPRAKVIVAIVSK
jgi:hypothetical protein